jgi:hypothetical protein
MSDQLFAATEDDVGIPDRFCESAVSTQAG